MHCASRASFLPIARTTEQDVEHEQRRAHQPALETIYGMKCQTAAEIILMSAMGNINFHAKFMS